MKKILAVSLAILMMVTPLIVSGADAVTIYDEYALADAFETGGSYSLGNDVKLKSTEVKRDITIDGADFALKNTEYSTGSTLYQLVGVTSVFRNITLRGSTKRDVGIWISAGTMRLENSTVKSFRISDGRLAAIAVAGEAGLVLENTTVTQNEQNDIYLTDGAHLTVGGNTEIGTVRALSNYVKLHIAADFTGSLTLTYDTPVAKCIGTVESGADIAGITLTNEGYYLEAVDGKLMMKTDNEAAIRFDMSQRETLYKGSTGFLYGEAEINVPSVDLLYGLQPDTMVQKAFGGKQHPTGDAVRTSSALLAAGVRDMQIYLQDHYLEWPYDAPMKDGTIDLDAYQKVVESILYGMICDEVSAETAGAFRGSDGKYYVLNENAAHYSYVLFNEPDQIWYGGNLDGLKAAWKKIYFAVHAIDPKARCVGPNFSGFNAEQYDSFLRYCRDNDCLPEIISWHELGDISMTDYYDHYDAVKRMQTQYYTGDFQPQLMVNEYARHYDIGSPGGLVKWLSMFEDKDMSGCMAYWAMANTLNEMAADQNAPTSTWWVYHWYAQMTGKQCPITAPDFKDSRFWGVTSYDENLNMAYALFGGNENRNGTESVYLDNMSSTDLLNANGAVNVKLYSVSFSGQLGANYKSQLVFDGAVQTSGDTLKLTAVDTDEMQAYFAVITKAEDAASAVTLDGVTHPVMSYEAENATLLGDARAYDKFGWTSFATSNRGDVGNINQNGDGVRFDITVPADGYYTASLFYSLQAPYVNPKTLVPDANGQNRGIGKALPYGVALDGNKLDDITLESTVVWAYKSHCDMRLYLTAGAHTLDFTHINGDERFKGNLQLSAALDKLTLAPSDDKDNDFEINLDEMASFKTAEGYRVTAVAPEAGYYAISADGDITVKKQCIDYAADATSYAKCAVYDVAVGSTVYLAKGANTLLIQGVGKVYFKYAGDKTQTVTTTVNAADFTLHGNNPILKSNQYAAGGYTVSELGIGQSPLSGDKGELNYLSFKVNAKTDGVYNLGIRYTNDEPAPIMLKADGSTYIHPYNIDLVERYAQIAVNGGEPETVYFKNTLSLDTFRTVDVQVTLHEGENTIKIYNDNSYQFSTLVNSTAPEIDCITVSRLSYDGTAADFIKGGASTKHSGKTATTVTKATTKANGKTVSDFTCVECGYHHIDTKTVSKIASVKLAKTAFVYTGKKQKPAVTVKDAAGKTVGSGNYTVSYAGNQNVGTATATVTFKGDYSGTVKLKFRINPKPTALSKVTAGKKSFTASWKKQTTQTTGYQIQYALKSNFSGAKTVTVTKNKTVKSTVKKLKSKKKYYVRVRTYKTVGKTKFYSAWSKVKTVKTK